MKEVEKEVEILLESMGTLEVKDGDIIILKCRRLLEGEERDNAVMIGQELSDRFKENFPNVQILVVGQDWDISILRKKEGEGEVCTVQEMDGRRDFL